MTSHASHRPVSALRARMIEDMKVRGFTEKTRNDYVRNVRAFAAFIGRSPDTATAEDLRRFQLHQTRTGMQPPRFPGRNPVEPLSTRQLNRAVHCRCRGRRDQETRVAAYAAAQLCHASA